METHRGGDNPVGAQPQAFGQLSFQRTLPHHKQLCKQSQYQLFAATGPSQNCQAPNPLLPMSSLIGIRSPKHYPACEPTTLSIPYLLLAWAVSYSSDGPNAKIRGFPLDVYCGGNLGKLSNSKSVRRLNSVGSYHAPPP